MSPARRRPPMPVSAHAFHHDVFSLRVCPRSRVARYLSQLCLGAVFIACHAFAAEEDPRTFLRDALAAEARFDSPAALDLLLRAHTARPQDAFILEKISRQLSELSEAAIDLDEKKRLCSDALAYAQRAVALEPDNAVNVLSLAISYGKLALCSDIRTKIEYSRLVREHADRALALDPTYAYAHHVLGRWHYEVATLGPAKRLVARVIYGGLPPASTTEAVHHLRRAVELAPDVLAHRVELAFALLADRQTTAARETFTHALTLPSREKYDEQARQRARTALDSMN